MGWMTVRSVCGASSGRLPSGDRPATTAATGSRMLPGEVDRFIWAYIGGTPIVNAPHSMAELPASTPLSDRISKDLKKRGFKFVGSTIIYAFMQAVGMVDDHMVWCPWHTSRRNN